MTSAEIDWRRNPARHEGDLPPEACVVQSPIGVGCLEVGVFGGTGQRHIPWRPAVLGLRDHVGAPRQQHYDDRKIVVVCHCKMQWGSAVFATGIYLCTRFQQRQVNSTFRKADATVRPVSGAAQRGYIAGRMPCGVVRKVPRARQGSRSP